MISDRDQFASDRPDGRYVCTMAAQMAMIRDHEKELAIPKNCDVPTLTAWKEAVRRELSALLRMPEPTPEPPPKKLSSVQRDGYRVEKWEFYPDDYSAVPFLALIPDAADAGHPVPAVLCFLGSNHTKEMAAGEPIPDHPNYSETKFYERNQMAKHYVKAGFAAFVFDNPGIGETAIRTDPSSGETQWATRTALCHGYLEMGLTYPGVSVFQKLRFLDHLSNLDYVDGTRIAASGHSLGTETAIMLGLLSDRISAIVFNDNLCDEQRRYTAITEEDERHMTQNPGNWHLIPGRMTAFSFPELCAAFAPRPLALTEGGADEFIGRVRRVYEAFGVPDNLFVSHYPRYQDPATRTFHGRVPDRALTFEQYYYECCYCDAPDHSFRASPAIEFLKKRFSL